MAELRKLITAEEEKRKKEKAQAKRLGKIEVDKIPLHGYEHTKVEDIVVRMKQRYETLGYGKVKGKGVELKEKVIGRRGSGLDRRTPADLVLMSGFVGFVGKLHKKLPFLNFLTNRLTDYSSTRLLPRSLDKANMNYSKRQYVSICFIAAMFMAIVVLSLGLALSFFVFNEFLRKLVAETVVQGPLFKPLLASFEVESLVFTLTYVIGFLISSLLSFVVFSFVLLVAFQVPVSAALGRGKAIDKELPYALRHMATEVRAGMGIHKTMKSIVEAGYGELSVEFDRTLREIDRGMSTEEALLVMSERSPSDYLSKALIHIVRALKTGGNLSMIIGSMASDVSFELRMSMKDFVERLNLVGLFYMMVGVVFPVFVAVLAGIFNAIPTIGLGGMLGTEILFMIYFILIPLSLSLILYIIKVMQPM